MVANELFQIVSAGDKMFGQGVEQFRVRGWVGIANVIFRLDQSSTEEVFPIPVDQRFGKVRIVRARQANPPNAIVDPPRPGI